MKAIPIDNYSSLIFECYETDNELIEKWHTENSNLEKCVEFEIDYLKTNNVSVYKLLDDSKETVGYFGEQFINNTNYLTGFFIKPEYRKKQYIKEFWNIVNLLFENQVFYAGLHKKNERAINFLLKNNALKVFEYDNSIFFMMNWEC